MVIGDVGRLRLVVARLGDLGCGAGTSQGGFGLGVVRVRGVTGSSCGWGQRGHSGGGQGRRQWQYDYTCATAVMSS